MVYLNTVSGLMPAQSGQSAPQNQAAQPVAQPFQGGLADALSHFFDPAQHVGAPMQLTGANPMTAAPQGIFGRLLAGMNTPQQQGAAQTTFANGLNVAAALPSGAQGAAPQTSTRTPWTRFVDGLNVAG